MDVFSYYAIEWLKSWYVLVVALAGRRIVVTGRITIDFVPVGLSVSTSGDSCVEGNTFADIC
jgi:hypothetical protein